MIPQDGGTIKYADALKLVYFDQHREHLASHLTLKEALCRTVIRLLPRTDDPCQWLGEKVLVFP